METVLVNKTDYSRFVSLCFGVCITTDKQSSFV